MGRSPGGLSFRSPDLDGYRECRQVAETDTKVWHYVLAVNTDRRSGHRRFSQRRFRGLAFRNGVLLVRRFLGVGFRTR